MADSSASPDSLEDRARQLASTTPTHRGRGRPRRFHGRVERLRRDLLTAVGRLTHAEASASIAAEWLLDNEYLVLRAADQLRVDLPPGFYGVLPKVDDGDRARSRAEVVARSALEASGGFMDALQIERFVRAFQSRQALDIGEVWALPSFLRLVILEEIVALANVATGTDSPGSVNEGMATAVGSLRALENTDWAGFFESVSIVDRYLRLDPRGVYARLDFVTRDRYRRAVEELSRWSGLSEGNVSRRLLGFSQEVDAPLGGLLLGRERPTFERILGCHVPWKRRVDRFVRRQAGLWYFGGAFLLSAGALAGLLFPLLVGDGGAPIGLALVAAVLAVVPATSIGFALANYLAALAVTPRPLPRLDFTEEIPDDARTLVAVPALLTDAHDIDALVRQMELNHRGNASRNLPFVLLADPTDADERELPTDVALLRLAAEGIEQLNERYGSEDGPTPFLLMTRARRWNEAEGCWMAWERKRGKLEELNELLLGRESGLFLAAGDGEALDGVRFVLTLDADTFLPEGSAARLIGTLAHPLHEARFDDRGRVVDGYTVLQPRIDTVADSGAETWFSSMHHANEGFDLYAHAASDAYQDLFGEGLYAGKGLYDVESFARCLRGRVPDNALLSHDLFEGIHGRVALVSDVSVIEEYPSHPVAYLRRSHRWVRGDWQLLPWLARKVSTRDGAAPNRLSAFARWKVLDNLRRSLMALSLVALTLTGWWWLPGSWWWSAVPLVVFSFPVLLGAVATSRFPRWRQAMFRTSVRRTAWAVARALTDVALLPLQAWFDTDAIGRTLFRLGVSRKNLLQWRPASATARSLMAPGGASMRSDIWLPSVLVSGVAFVGALAVGVAWLPALPLLVAWLAAPALAALLGRELPARSADVTPVARKALRRLARRTWAYFDRLVGPEDHWLPPDNLQLHPVTDVARRTSPTNIGLGLLSHIVGYDLGYVPASRLAATLASTLDTMDRLERHRGHLLNWYDTRQLRPLSPRYVSSVDSGNLAVCVVSISRGLEDVATDRLPRPAHADGLVSAFEVLAEILEEFHGIELFRPDAVPATLRRVAAEIEEVRHDPVRFAEGLAALHAVGLPTLQTEVARALEAPRAEPPTGSLGAVREWVRGVDRQVSALNEELERFVPWLGALRRAPRFYRSPEEAVAGAWAAFVSTSEPAPRLADVPAVCTRLLARLDDLDGVVADSTRDADETEAARRWNEEVRRAVSEARSSADALLAELRRVRARLDDLVAEMDFGFLYDPARRLLRVGYHVDGATLDRSYYDLYASEARLASYVAIAKGDVPAEHWTRLGRPFARRDGSTLLLSWAGTMFEYLMPSLFLRTHKGSLADVSCRRAIDAQVRHGSRLGIPWGVSESGFNQTDPQKRYRYRAFGVSELSVRRDPSARIVSTPYASVLALAFEPREVWRNLLDFEALGALGPLGFFEATDFGAGGARRPQLVRSFMAHHQGMILAALDNYLNDSVLVERFHRDPRVAAFDYLLREAAPSLVRVQPPRTPARSGVVARPAAPPALPVWSVDPAAFPPPTTVVSNGSLSTLVTASGGGGVRWRGKDVTRWRPDPTTQEWGTWIYVRDVESDRLWSTTAAPTWTEPDRYEVVFGAHMVEFQREDHGIGMRTSVVVAPPGDVEIRRVTLVNESRRARVLELTSFAEVALADPGEDRRHQAFAKLFVEGRYASRAGALLLARRARGPEDVTYLAHTVAGSDGIDPPLAWEIDREAFLGRGGSMRAPRGVRRVGAGGVADEMRAPLDPIMSVTTRVEIPPGEQVSVAFLTAVAEAPGTALAILDAYRSPERVEFALNQARDRERALIQDLAVRGDLVPTFQRLLTGLVFPYHGLRGGAMPTSRAHAPHQESLWAGGISGDLPVVLVEVHREGDGLVDELVRAHSYWERHGVRFDLVAVGHQEDGYAEPLRGHVYRVLADLGLTDRLEQRGGVHFISFGRMADDALEALRRAASVVLIADGRTLGEHLAGLEKVREHAPPFVPVSASGPPEPEVEPLDRPVGLAFDNGLGGFGREGAEYVIHLAEGQSTPAPWCNVLAHEHFGCLVSESGAGYTWIENSGEKRLTRWRNDPVADPPSEALYLRDEETSRVWSVTPAPAPAAAPYRVAHGTGVTTFHHASHGLEQRLDVFTPRGESVKVVELTLTNVWRRPRRLTATYYAEWVLGVHRWDTGPHVTTAISRPDQALLASNPFHPVAEGLVAYLASSEPIHGFTCDRSEFLGPEGDLSRPAGLVRIGLGSRVGAALDPCAALQVHLDLAPGETRSLRFLLGAAESEEAVGRVLGRFRQPGGDGGDQVGAAVAAWEELTGRVRVKTPEPAMDLLLNRWLLYQTVGCRLWGRSGVYQSSGAFGFRDQLQDSLSLRLHAPQLTRHQILEAARHQFTDGDVLHWWHPDDDRGVRTRCSDDLVWLPFAVAEYVDGTGDTGILDASVPYLQGPPLVDGEMERYDHFDVVSAGPLYEHCLAALERAGTRSPRGLPLIGSGDWNDALNRVGHEGRGESMWLAWFLYATHMRFASICDDRGDHRRGAALRDEADRLRASVEAHGWDGAWYQRATYDDGTPIGTAGAPEGAIDSLTQSWAVLSGGADDGRARKAMASVLERLVLPVERLVLLLTPPFHDTRRDPGYIRAYPPGVRENGGQYTHAAAWVGLAFAQMGDGERAAEIFRLLNPILRTPDKDATDRYRVEPYVLAGDVYGSHPHVGRGGWTWYTGSAGWMYRLGLEGILGVKPVAGGVEIEPCIPSAWQEYEVTIRVGADTSYRFVVRNPDGVERGVVSIRVDGVAKEGSVVPLADDGGDHEVVITLGEAEPLTARGDVGGRSGRSVGTHEERGE